MRIVWKCVIRIYDGVLDCVCKSPLCLDRWTTRLRHKKFTVRLFSLARGLHCIILRWLCLFPFHMGPSKEKSEFICLQLKSEAGKTMCTGMFLLFCSSSLFFLHSLSSPLALMCLWLVGCACVNWRKWLCVYGSAVWGPFELVSQP